MPEVLLKVIQLSETMAVQDVFEVIVSLLLLCADESKLKLVGEIDKVFVISGCIYPLSNELKSDSNAPLLDVAAFTQ